jgi:hypothetical protein
MYFSAEVATHPCDALGGHVCPSGDKIYLAIFVTASTQPQLKLRVTK